MGHRGDPAPLKTQARRRWPRRLQRGARRGARALRARDERLPACAASARSATAIGARGRRRDGGTVTVPTRGLTPAVRDEIARLGHADIMVGIPSFKNAATIGYVVRAAQAGLVQYFPDLRPVLVNSDAGSPDGTGRVVVETEPPDYVEQILLVRPDEQARPGQPDLPRDRRRRRQGRGAADDLRDRRRARGPGARRRRLATCARSSPSGSSSSPARSSRAATTTSRRSTPATSTTARSRTPSPTR